MMAARPLPPCPHCAARRTFIEEDTLERFCLQCGWREVPPPLPFAQTRDWWDLRARRLKTTDFEPSGESDKQASG